MAEDNPEALTNNMGNTERVEIECLRQELAGLQKQVAHQQEESLRYQQEAARYRLMVESAHDLVTMLSAEGVVLYQSPAATYLLGYTPQELLDQNVFDYVHPDDYPVVQEGFANVLKLGKPQTRTYRVRRANGTWAWVESLATNRLADPNIQAIIMVSRDITERKEAELALQVAQQRYQTVVENAPISLFSMDTNGIFTFVEGKGMESLGVQPRDIIGQSVFTLYGAYPVIEPNGNITTADAMMRRVLQGESVCCVTPIGSIFFESRFSTIRDEHGQATEITGVTLDVTERKQAEERLQYLSQGLHEVIAAADELLAMPDLDTLLRRAVEIGRQRLGLERCAIYLKEPESDMLHGTYGTNIRGETTDERKHSCHKYDLWAHSLLDPSPVQLPDITPAGTRWLVDRDLPLVNSEGHNVFPLNKQGWVAATPISSPEGPIGILFNDSAISDGPFDEVRQELVLVYCSLLGHIIERKRIEEALGQSEQKFRALIENSSDMITIINTEGVVLFEAPAIERILGYRPEEVVGRNELELVHPDDLATVRSVLQQAIEHPGETYSAEYRFPHKDGSWRYCESIGKTLDADSAASGIVMNSRDITERKQLESELKTYTVRLEHSNQELQDFAYVASHDLQEPLRKIQTFTNLILNKHAAELSDQARDYLVRAQNASERMHVLITDLLSLSRIATKGQQFQPVALNCIVQEVLADLEIRIQESHAIIDCGLLPEINADPLQIRQLFQNLIGNALKFQKPDRQPEIKIRSQVTEVQPDRMGHKPTTGNICHISVQDNGIGFDEQYLERIFQPFQRLHGRVKYEGTGMGLAICRRIVERHGGVITARSVPGEGATFIVTLPMQHQ